MACARSRETSTFDKSGGRSDDRHTGPSRQADHFPKASVEGMSERYKVAPARSSGIFGPPSRVAEPISYPLLHLVLLIPHLLYKERMR